MSGKIRAVHYLNQFFGGLGGEEQADTPPQWRDGPIGPGNLIAGMAPSLDIVGTVIAGDNYMADGGEHGVAEVLALIAGNAKQDGEIPADVLLAGPAFNAGRYGMACGAVCRAVGERWMVPGVTALFDENPAVEIYRRTVTIVRTGADVMAMRDAAAGMVRVGLKLVAGETVSPAADGTIAKGLRQNYFAEASGADRAIDMLLRKLAGQPFISEYAMPVFDRVAPAPPVKDLTQVTLALVTSGGIVPRGNPDRIESANASKFGAYSLAGLGRLNADSHQTVHGGYDPTYANQDPNRVLPLDVVRTLEHEGRIGRLHETYYATVGNATSVERAKLYGAQIATLLVNEGVQAVILTST